MSTRAAVANFFFWVLVAMTVNAAIWVYFGYYYSPGAGLPADPAYGARLASEFFGAWAMEKALSLDNLFMFYFIFSVFHTPNEARPRVLRWGIIGVVLLRGAVILGGTALLNQFRWLLFGFAAFLIYASVKIFFFAEDEEEDDEAKQADLERNWLVRFAGRFLNFEKRYVGSSFWTTVDGKRRATLLLLVAFVIEGTDLPFAFDSLPAAMAVSQSFWIVITSNVLAVLGLRSIYFLIQNMRDRFAHMQQGIGVLLAFAGVKILLPQLGLIVRYTVGLVYPDITRTVDPSYGIHLPLWFSVAFIATIIVGTIAYTLARTRPVAAGSIDPSI